jgi:hypothetical protein
MGVASLPEVPVTSPSHAARDVAPVYIRGMTEPLPAGERLLWEGAPQAGLVATHVFHRRLVWGYFLLLLGWWGVTTVGTLPMSDWGPMLAVRVALSAIVIGTVEVLARVVARTSWYALTNKRLVLRIGMVLPMTINVPLRVVQDAAVGTFKDGSGQIALSLVAGQRLAYIALWPHCRVFSFSNPKPVLRGLSQPDQVAALLRDAVTADADV